MNKQTRPNLTKTCSSCGEQKPLSAFLQMSGTQHGTAYGNICASCRKTAKEATKRKKTEAEGSTTSETGHRIGSKAKVHEAIEKREHDHKTEEEYHEERKLDEEDKEEKIEKKQDIKHKERSHREEYLKKGKDVVTPADRKAAAKREATQRHGAEIVSREEQFNEDTATQAHGVKENRKKTGVDLSDAYRGQQISGTIKHTQNVHLRQFSDWVGNRLSAPTVGIVSDVSNTTRGKQAGSLATRFDLSRGKTPAAKGKGNIKAPAGKPHADNAQITKTDKAEPAKHTTYHRDFLGNSDKTEKSQDKATEFVEKNWRPGSKR